MPIDASGTDRIGVAGSDISGGATSLSGEETDALADKIGGMDFFTEDSDESEVIAADEDLVEREDDDTEEDEAEEKADDDTEEDEAEEEAEEEVEAAVPASYRRSLRARGWDDNEIDAFYTGDPNMAMQTFDRIHTSRVEELRSFAQLGRQALPAEPVATSEKGADAVSGLIDIDALVEKYGEENAELVREIAGPLNAMAERILPMIPVIERGVQATCETEQATLKTQIDTFFGSKPLRAYDDFYGDEAKGRSPQEQERYLKVLGMADAMIAGAELQGKSLPVDEALEAAHLSTAADFSTTAVRKSLKKTLKKKAASVSLKPDRRGKRTATSRKGPAKNRQEMEQRVADGLAAALG